VAADPLQPFGDETAYPLATSADTRDRLEALAGIRAALSRLAASLGTGGRERRAVDELASYCETLARSPLPQAPREQFDVLYHFRKLLLWAPVSLLGGGGGRLEAPTLVTLAHLYASALAMEPVFPDIGAAFLGGLAAAPLAQCVLRAQAYAEGDDYAAGGAGSGAVAQLMEFPRAALEAYQRRREWAQRDSLQLPRPQQAQSQQQSQTPNQQQQQQQQQFDLGSLPLELNVGGEYAYTPSLSPAFPSSSIQLATTPAPATTHVATPPFLTVPSSAVDPFGFAAYTPAASSYATQQQLVSTAGYTVASPALVSPFASTFDAEAAAAAFQLSHAAYSPSLLSTADAGSIAASEAGSTTSPEHPSSMAGAFSMYTALPSNAAPTGYEHQHHHGGGAGIAGGCVPPVAIWT
jgi:hypothetical protein